MERPPGGRPKAVEIWEHVTVVEDLKGKFRGKRVKCNQCGLVFAASANRIKSHLNKIKGQGVQICTGFPPPRNNGSNKGVCSDLMENLRYSQGLSKSDSPRDYNMVNKTELDCYMSPKTMWEGIKALQQVQIHTSEAKHLERIQVGPFVVSTVVNERDMQLIQYVFENNSREPQEVVFSTSRLHLDQSNFTTLKPETFLDALVIDAFAEILTNIERKKTWPSNCYLPLMTFSNVALSGNVNSFMDSVKKHKIRESYMFGLVYCEKIFVPIHFEKNSIGHFYLYVLHIKKQELEIWDPLADQFINKKERDETTQKLLLAMDNLFPNEKFTKYQLTMANNIMLQPNGYDCGVFVINFMQQSDNYVKRNQFDSEEERLDLALKLLKSDLNKIKETLYSKAARRLNARSENDEDSNWSGFKRKRVDTYKTCFEDVRKAACIELDDSDSRVKRTNVGFKTGYSKGYILPATNLVGMQFESYIKQIWEWIMGDEVSTIGIWGMGGSGKTALATHIHNKILEEAGGEFDHVSWVTASQHTSICQMQKVMARSINLDISDEYEVKRIAGKLLQAFKHMNKCIVILDDVWDHIFLEEVGFPILDNHIKLILTTRLLEVCQGMDCKDIIELKSLDEKDSWALFEKTLGVHEGLPIEVEKRAPNMMLEYCDGLPLAIVAIARSMKGKKHVSEWRHMLECLENLDNGQFGMDKWVFPVLRSSYAFLNNKLQRCFLYCALSALEYFDDSKAQYLIRRFVYDEWMNETKKLMAQYHEGYSMLEKLKNNRMLEEGKGGNWRMHNLLKVMAFGIAKDTSKIMIKANMSLTEIPFDGKWKEDLQKVFLTGNNIQEIPNGTSPKCSQLSTLLLDYNFNLKWISDDFFNNMPALKILDLSKTNIERLPESVSNLKCLNALLLVGCETLNYVPSLVKLLQLISLDLSHTAITEAPFGLELLVNLRRLNLLGTHHLKMSASLVSKMTNLECLELNHIPNSMDACAQYIQGLKKLEVISANFCDIDEFNTYVMSFLGRDCANVNYHLSLAIKSYDTFYWETDKIEFFQKKVVFNGVDLGDGVVVLPENITELVIKNCDQQTSTGGICHFLSFGENDNLHHIKRLDIELSEEVEYLFCFSSNCCFCSSVQLGQHLRLCCLKGLKNIVSPFAPSLQESNLFSHLKILTIRQCNVMKTLLTLESLEQLQNLETIEVRRCDSMEEIVGEDYVELILPGNGNVSDHTITLPKLISVTLEDLPELNFVYKGIMFCPSLQRFCANMCNKLNRPQIKISNGSTLEMEWDPCYNLWSFDQ